MAKFGNTRAPVTGPITTTDTPALTGTGGVGNLRSAKSELFLLAVSNMVGEQTFHENAASRDARYRDLIHQVTADDPEWVARLVPYLRQTANLRSAPVVMACEYVKAHGPHGRAVINAACVRADEPVEILAYWHQHYGRSLPAAIQRGLADACARLYTERNAAKYDGNGAYRFADVIELIHPAPVDPDQAVFWKYLLDTRHHGNDAHQAPPAWTARRQTIARLPEDDRATEIREAVDAGFTWEDIGGWLPGGWTAAAWEAVIPNMNYMALLRNLRNFDKYGVSDAAAARVTAKLSDPAEVAASRQFPIRFLSAWRSIESLRWAPAIERGLEASVANVPTLPGKTLIMIDVSPSMVWAAFGEKSDRKRYEIAAIFGYALAKRAEHATIVAYSGAYYSEDRLSADVTDRVRLPLLRCLDLTAQDVQAGGGTETFRAVAKHYAGHDRVVILTDEQTSDAGRYDLSGIPAIFTFNCGGYEVAHMPSGEGRYTFGGLNDSAFTMLAILDRSRSAGWPHLA